MITRAKFKGGALDGKPLELHANYTPPGLDVRTDDRRVLRYAHDGDAGGLPIYAFCKDAGDRLRHPERQIWAGGAFTVVPLPYKPKKPSP